MSLPFSGYSLVPKCVCLSHIFWNSFCSCHSVLAPLQLSQRNITNSLRSTSRMEYFPSSAFSLFIKQIENESNKSLQAWMLLGKWGKGYTHMCPCKKNHSPLYRTDTVCKVTIHTLTLTFIVGFSTWTRLAGWYLGLCKSTFGGGCTVRWLFVFLNSAH